MNKEEYLAKRNELLAQAEGFINEAKFEESTEIQNEIKTLDSTFEAAAKELANINALKEQTFENIENKSVDVKGATVVENQGVGEVVNKKELIENAFAKTLMGKELTADEMTNLAVTSDNQVVIPQHTMDEIIGLVTEQYPFFGHARRFDYHGVLTLPKHKAILSGDARTYRETEGTVVEENEMVEIKLVGIEVAKMIEISFKLEVMSISAFMAYFRDELVERIGALVGTMVYTGIKANEQFEGCVDALKTVGQGVEYPAGSQLAYDSITAAMAKIASKFTNFSSFYVNNATLWNQLATIKDGKDSSTPLFIPDPTGGTVGRIFGRQVHIDGGLPDGVIVVGDARSGYAINVNKQIQVESQRDLVKRSTKYLAHAIMDGAVTNEKALAVISPAAASGASTKTK